MGIRILDFSFEKKEVCPWYQQGDSQDVRCTLVIGLPIGIGFHLVFELSDKQIKKLTMWNFFYWTSLANNCSPFERKVLFKMLFSCFQLDFEITVTLEWIEWFKCYELFGTCRFNKQNQNKKNNNNKQSMTDPLGSKWCRPVMCYFEFLFTKLYLFKISLILSIIYVGNYVYVLNNPNHQKSYKEITMIVFLVAELLM